jgi:hypothetical protein
MSKDSFKDKYHSMDTLQNHKNKPLFEVPEHYFEQLQRDVMQRVAKEEKRLKISKKWISAVSVAASLTLIFLLSYFLFVNKNFEEHFYAFGETNQQDDTIISQDPNCLVETIEILVEEPTEMNRETETSVPKNTTETIVYRAVDFYVDDYETYNFCEVMFDLECYFDY